MDTAFNALRIAFKIWMMVALTAIIILCIFLSFTEPYLMLFPYVIISIVTIVFSFPAFLILLVALPLIRKLPFQIKTKVSIFLGLQWAISLLFTIIGASLDFISSFFNTEIATNFLITSLLLNACLVIGLLIANIHLQKQIWAYLANDYSHLNGYQPLINFQFSSSINKNKMHTTTDASPSSNRNQILVKGFITGVLILLMLIPTIFIMNLITEREALQKEVVKEVSSKWAGDQNLSGPFLTVPYTKYFTNSNGKTGSSVTELILLPTTLQVKGFIKPEERPRSIYKVLLYKTDVNFAGNFNIDFPEDIKLEQADFSKARICFTLNDFKGIEEDIYINFNNQKILLRPGLPVNDFGETGLSAPVTLNAMQLSGDIPFLLDVKLKGSEQLHFMPLAASSKFSLSSSWPSPSFNGNILPGKRTVDKNGFTAEWNFNQANLPFNITSFTKEFKSKDIGFGVSLVQPADHYNKTMRSVKYAILFIGLTFGFFFIIELLQKNPLHPVQYVLVGLALVIFYSLLLSISEYIVFDFAYLIAAGATILLITFYAKGHFKSWKTAGIFFLLLSCLYSFIFVLIRLEDTALLVGSIGLFLVLAFVMYASRKINWYPVNNLSNN